MVQVSSQSMHGRLRYAGLGGAWDLGKWCPSHIVTHAMTCLWSSHKGHAPFGATQGHMGGPLARDTHA
jgi:hypothetical protein